MLFVSRSAIVGQVPVAMHFAFRQAPDHMLVIDHVRAFPRPMVGRWQRRYEEEGLDGLLRDKTRPPGIAPVPQAKVHAVVERTLRAPPEAVTH